MTDNSTSYKSIFKSTALFGFVQIFNIAIKAILTKIVALLLGAEGMGIIGLFNSSINVLKTGAGLGIPQSAVRDISEANGNKNEISVSQTISTVNRIIIITAILGLIITICLAPFLSKWNFNSSNYTIPYIWLSIAVALNIYYEGRQSILTGCRKLKDLAKANVFGSLFGLLIAIPCYFIWGIKGIVPSLIVLAITNVLISNHFVKKIRFSKVKLSIKSVLRNSSRMVQMGIALMAVSFIGFLFDLIISSYISHSSNLEMVGYYQAGTTIIGGYFGIIFTAISIDYYPRISAVNKNNTVLTQEMNKQSESGLLFIFPLVITFIFLSNFFIRILYDENFEITNQYTDVALIGTIMIIVSNSMGMILLAKQNVKIFIISVVIQRAILIAIYILFFNLWGLTGLGYAYIVTGFLHLSIMTVILRHYYKIFIGKRVLGFMTVIICISVAAIFARQIKISAFKYLIGGIIWILSLTTCWYYSKHYMGINIKNLIFNKFSRK